MSNYFTDGADVIGIISAATGAISGEPLFYITAALAFTLSFGMRLGYEHRIEKYLTDIKGGKK